MLGFSLGNLLVVSFDVFLFLIRNYLFITIKFPLLSTSFISWLNRLPRISDVVFDWINLIMKKGMMNRLLFSILSPLNSFDPPTCSSLFFLSCYRLYSSDIPIFWPLICCTVIYGTYNLQFISIFEHFYIWDGSLLREHCTHLWVRSLRLAHTLELVYSQKSHEYLFFSGRTFLACWWISNEANSIGLSIHFRCYPLAPCKNLYITHPFLGTVTFLISVRLVLLNFPLHLQFWWYSFHFLLERQLLFPIQFIKSAATSSENL